VGVQLTSVGVDQAGERSLVTVPGRREQSRLGHRVCARDRHRDPQSRPFGRAQLIGRLVVELTLVLVLMDPAHSRPVVHLELHTAALSDARSFYAPLCGWDGARIETRFGSYQTLRLGPLVSGGIVQCPTERALWLPYVEVGDVEAMTNRARQLGGRVLLPPREGPAGWRSVVATPAAGELAFWQPKR
jgi:predicted enzyme related to lactoylglutathione lyase